MTKFSKVGKSSIVIAILSFLLVAVLTFGGTYAYFSAVTGSATGKITMGALYVDLKDGNGSLTELGEIALAHPNQRILHKVDAAAYIIDFSKTTEDNETLTSTIHTFVRVKVTATLDSIDTELTDEDDESSIVYVDAQGNQNQGDDNKITPLNIFTVTAGDNWYQNIDPKSGDGYTYYVASKGTTAANTNVLAVDTAETTSIKLPLSIVVNKEVGKNGSTFFMGATGSYSITVEVIQAQYLDDSATPNNTYTVEKLAAQWNNIKTAGTYPVPEQGND